MAYRIESNIKIENAKIIFPNFSGKETKFNRLGNRNFNILIEDHGFAEQLMADGWNVRPLAKRDEDDEQHYTMNVQVRFYGGIPPRVWLVTMRGKTMLNEATIGELDYAEITNVDLVIRPYNWDISGKTGVKAYLKTMYVTIEEDEFADKYADFDRNAVIDEDCPF